jgi:hypothetical protein
LLLLFAGILETAVVVSVAIVALIVTVVAPVASVGTTVYCNFSNI